MLIPAVLPTYLHTHPHTRACARTHTHTHTHTDVQCDSETLESGLTRTAAETVFAPLHSASLPPLHSHRTTTNYGHSLHSAEQYSPGASPVHIPLHLSLSSSSVKSSLAHLQRGRNMREMALLAEKVLTHACTHNTHMHTYTYAHIHLCTHTHTHTQPNYICYGGQYQL